MAYVITEKAATALTRLLRGDKSTGNTGIRGGPATISPDAFPAPFTVRWSASEDSGSGAWVIWLPNATQLLVYDGSAVTITGITAATELPAGWYTIDALQASSTAVYLVVTVVETTGVASAELSNTTGQATSGEKVYNLLVATMSTDSTTGAKRVKQFIDSAVVLGGGSSAPASTPQPFDIEGGKVVRCEIPAPIERLSCADYTIVAASGNIYAHVDRSSSGSGSGSTYTLTVDQTSRANSATHAQWVLYYKDVNGDVTCDCRPKILSLYDLTT